MKISKLYCSEEGIFEDINFNEKLNIILAEIRKPENKQKSSHCLGKSMLASLIDFCLLKKVGKEYFLKKNPKLFDDFVFFLEIKIDEEQYLTIRRKVKAKTKIAIKTHNTRGQNYRDLPDEYWDFVNGFEKAKKFINDALSFDILPMRSYRDSISYFLRSPESFNNVFRLPKYMQTNDVEWKPIVAELLGFEAKHITMKYQKDKILDSINQELAMLVKNEYETSLQEERLKVVLSLKVQELEKKEEQYDKFDFTEADIEKPEILATQIDEQISALVKENYYLKNKIEQGKKSIIKYDIDLKEIQYFYNEIGIYFESQLNKDYSDLIQFNKEILSERNEIVQEMLKEYGKTYEENKSSIKELNEQKIELLSYINSTNTFEKFKFLQHEITELRTQIESINAKIVSIDTITELNAKKSQLETEISSTIVSIKQDFFGENNIYIETIRKHFNNILMRVLGDAGVISTPLNKNNNIEFVPEIIDMNTSQVSSKDKGTTYKKLMCCSLDLALLATYSKQKFIHFVYHDGVFDGLDSRQKDNFYDIIKEYSEKYNIQYIFSSIQDELPQSIQKYEKIKELKREKTIVKVLHDEGNDGRLFKMDAF